MKQIFQDSRNGHLLVMEVPVPPIAPNRILVENRFSLVSSGTERQVVKPGRSAQAGAGDGRTDGGACFETLIPLGYSCAGEVIATGPGIDRVSVGDPVACAGGGSAFHAEIVSVPDELLVAVPREVDFERAAFVALGAVSMHAVGLCGAAPGETVAVSGLSLLGLLAVQVLKAAGCRVVAMDRDRVHCGLAEELGCDFATDSADLLRSMVDGLTGRGGCDATIVFEAAPGDEPSKIAAEITRQRGRVVTAGTAGLGAPCPSFCAKDLELRVSREWGPRLFEPDYRGRDDASRAFRTARREMEAFMKLLAEGTVDAGKLISHCYGIERAEEAYRLVTTGERPYTGVLLSYPGRSALSGRAGKTVRSRAGNGPGNIGVGFIGAGNFAESVLLPAVQRYRGLDLLGASDPSGLSARGMADMFGFDYSTGDYSEILGDERVSSVLIAAPADLKAAVAAEAIRAGKHVFLEAPPASTEDQLKTLVDARRGVSAEAAGSPRFMICFHRRFSPFAEQLKRWIGGPGSPMVVNCRINAGPLRAGDRRPGEEEWNMTGDLCHFIDLVQFITGGCPVRVFASGTRNPARAGLADNTAINIESSDGSVAALSFITCGDASLPRERIEVFRDGSAAVIEDFESISCTGAGRSWTGLKGHAPDMGYDAALDAFFGAVAGRRSDLPSFDGQVATVLAAFAVEKSLREGTSVRVESPGSACPAVLHLA